MKKPYISVSNQLLTEKFLFITLIILVPIVCLSQTERWVYRYSGVSAYKSDEAYSIVYGSDNNVYIAGACWHEGTDYDFTVISLTNLGVERWVYKYHGPADYEDCAVSVVYGEDGNIYVAGSSYDEDTICAFTVISLSPTGEERWVYQYQGPGVGYSRARSIVYGSDGNLYATGCAYRYSTNNDLVVISLTTTGTERWVYRFNGPTNNSDEGYSVIYGADNYIYVAGKYDDYSAIVISLDGLGLENWTYQYHEHREDYAHSVNYKDENIYVTGVGITQAGYPMVPHIFVICLSDSGTEWVYEHTIPSSANATVCGADGRLYISGGLGDDIPDFLVISLTESGLLRWEYIHNTPILTFEIATSIVYGADGNIYAAGSVADSISGNDFAIVRLSTSGIEYWVYRYDRCGWGDCANAVCYGMDGNIYTAGMSTDDITGSDFTVISLNPDVGVQENTEKPQAMLNNFLKIEPNPFYDKVCIECRMAEDKFRIDDISLQIYDATGRLIDIISQEMLSGDQEVTWHAEDLPPGVYFLRLKGEDCSVVEKIVKVK